MFARLLKIRSRPQWPSAAIFVCAGLLLTAIVRADNPPGPALEPLEPLTAADVVEGLTTEYERQLGNIFFCATGMSPDDEFDVPPPPFVVNIEYDLPNDDDSDARKPNARPVNVVLAQLDQQSVFTVSLGAVPEGAAEKSRAKLDTKIKVDFDKTPLRDALSDIAKQVELPLFVDYEDLETNAGIAADKAITLKLENATAHQTLKIITMLVQPDDWPVSIGHAVDQDGILRFGNHVAHEARTVRGYDLRALIAELAADKRPGPRDEWSSDPTAEVIGQTIEQIMNLVRDSCGRQQDWALYGGELSSAREIGSVLIINAPAEIHTQVELLLQKLRAPAFSLETTSQQAKLQQQIADDQDKRALAIREKLGEESRYNLKGVALRDALDEISKRTGLRINLVKSLALRADTPVTIAGPGMSGRDALRQIAPPVTYYEFRDGDADCWALAPDGEIYVGHYAAVLKHATTVRAYNVNDLVSRWPEGLLSPFLDDDYWKRHADELLEAAKTFTGPPELWAATHPENQRMSLVGNRLVVRIDLMGQLDIQHQLQKMRVEAKKRLDSRLLRSGYQYIAADYKQTPLEDVFNDVGNKTGASMIIHWDDLENFGLTRETPISFSADHAIAVDIINAILRARDTRLGARSDQRSITVGLIRKRL